MFENIAELKSARAKKVFAFSGSTLLVLEIVLLTILHYRYSSIPEPLASILKEVLINLIATSIVAIILFTLVIFLLPLEEQLKSVEVLEPSETKRMHETALMNSDFWLHHGHMGRWVRITAMPALARSSVDKGIDTTVKLIILNPRNIQLCGLYCEYRNRIAFKENRITTTNDVQAELLATIILGQFFDQSPNGLAVQIFLTDQLALVREDISSTAVFRTQVDPRCSSIMYHNINREHEKAEFYNAAKTDFDFSARCCTRLLPNLKIPDGQITVSAIETYLKGVDLLVRSDATFLDDVLRRVTSDYHPYH